MSVTTRRIVRDTNLDAAVTAYGPFTIVAAVKLSATEPKFSAWITGARGRNGFRVTDRTGTDRIVGLTTLRDFNDRSAVTNFGAFGSDPAAVAPILRSGTWSETAPVTEPATDTESADGTPVTVETVEPVTEPVKAPRGRK